MHSISEIDLTTQGEGGLYCPPLANHAFRDPRYEVYRYPDNEPASSQQRSVFAQSHLSHPLNQVSTLMPLILIERYPTFRR